MDIRHLYNNPEDSDVTIKLHDGSLIYAHRIILKNKSEVFKKILQNKMLESRSGVITFPEYPDSIVAAVVKFLYDISAFSSLSDDAWMDLLRFAHFLSATALVDRMMGSVPYSIAASSLIEIGDQLSIDCLVVKGIRRFLGTHNNSKLGEYPPTDPIVLSMMNLAWDVYKSMREIWLREGFNLPTLLVLDCCYCCTNDRILNGASNGTLTALSELIPDIDLARFSFADLVACSHRQAVRMMPILTHTLRCLAKLKVGMKKQYSH